VCIAACAAFFGAVAGGFTESPSVHHAPGPSAHARGVDIDVVRAASDRPVRAHP